MSVSNNLIMAGVTQQLIAEQPDTRDLVSYKLRDVDKLEFPIHISPLHTGDTSAESFELRCEDFESLCLTLGALSQTWQGSVEMQCAMSLQDATVEAMSRKQKLVHEVGTPSLTAKEIENGGALYRLSPLAALRALRDRRAAMQSKLQRHDMTLLNMPDHLFDLPTSNRVSNQASNKPSSKVRRRAT